MENVEQVSAEQKKNNLSALQKRNIAVHGNGC